MVIIQKWQDRNSLYTLLQNMAYCIPSESCKSYKMVQYITYVWAAVHLNLNL